MYAYPASYCKILAEGQLIDRRETKIHKRNRTRNFWHEVSYNDCKGDDKTTTYDVPLRMGLETYWAWRDSQKYPLVKLTRDQEILPAPSRLIHCLIARVPASVTLAQWSKEGLIRIAPPSFHKFLTDPWYDNPTSEFPGLKWPQDLFGS